MTEFEPHMGVLPPAQHHLWPDLRRAPALGFVLYGGTAIALRLGHRSSIDFDFFTEGPLDRQDLHAAFPFLAGAQVLQDRVDTLTILATSPKDEGTIKVSFFAGIDFGRVGEPEWTKDRVLQVASLDDLLATKLKVLLQRVEAKDYRDIEALIAAGTSLDSGIGAARAMFGAGFQPSECLKALVYFEGGDLNTLSSETRESLVRAASAVRNLPVRAVVSARLAVR
jgi:hypothetical protein